jgi:hypothetical protein
MKNPEFAAMNEFEAIINDAVDISTMGGGHFRLMPGHYRVRTERNGGALLVRMDIKGDAPIPLTPMQWGISDAARFIKRR